jgi:ElaB/YqjD/DUF883 family membrane-anchored ribosome-binding protein
MTTQTFTNDTEELETSDVKSADATRKASMAAHKAVDTLVEPAAKAERKVRDLASRAEQAARDGKEQVVSRTESLFEEATDYAKRKPLAAAGISFAVGLLLSRFLRS